MLPRKVFTSLFDDQKAKNVMKPYWSNTASGALIVIYDSWKEHHYNYCPFTATFCRCIFQCIVIPVNDRISKVRVHRHNLNTKLYDRVMLLRVTAPKEGCKICLLITAVAGVHWCMFITAVAGVHWYFCVLLVGLFTLTGHLKEHHSWGDTPYSQLKWPMPFNFRNMGTS